MPFVPHRLTLARKRRGMNKTRLANEAGLSLRSITAFEGGEETPSAATLERLAQVLNFPIEFFDEPELEELAEESASFRALKRMTASQRDAVLSAGRLAVELSRWIEERIDLPTHDIPDLRETEPEAAAHALRARWGLGEQPIPNMVHLLESKGVRVFSLAEECAEVDAFALWWRGTPFVFLNTFKSGERGRFDAAHELGHLVLHRHGPPTGPECERQADAFASAFLMPRARVLATTPPIITVDTLIQLKRLWGVSVGALAYRLHSIKRLTEWNYRQIMVEISKRGFRKTEPNGIARETSQILSKVFEVLAKEGVSRKDVARHLRISRPDLEAMVFGLVVATGGKASASAPAAPSERPTLRLVDAVRGLNEGGEH